VSGERLFVYGTLRTGREPAAIRAVARTLRRCGAARLRGRLYDLGPYPGAIADPAAAWVHGEIVELTAASPPLAWFDAYEEFDPAQPDRGGYRRERHAVETDAGPVACWVYLLVREPAGAPRIASGEWRGPRSG
jgi:gamma-glutamylcyclotransferase (GGCT)/AIG2-like uncharacterized protein YtfP